MPSLHDLTFDQLTRLLTEEGLRPAHAKTLWNTLQFRSLVDPLSRDDLAPPLRRWLAAVLGSGAWTLDAPGIASDIPSGDGLTRKTLLKLADGQEIETVIMGYEGRHTACISTQAGCAMGCVFCATGQMGFARHLRPGEIVAQVHHARRVLAESGRRLRNLVFMGMGEPLHNYDAVMTALDIITHTSGINIGSSKVSISTVGVVPGIRRMAEENRPYNLAVSLHAASDEERGAIVPANTKWPLADLLAACRDYNARTGRRIFFAWTLIAGVNDTPEHARRVAALLHGLDAHVNLIPLNRTAGYEGMESLDSAADAFHRILQNAGFPCTIRQRRGIDVAAGCGQLKAEKGRRVKG
ncbi:MAG: 23S rRNA (adenine(2503)-C(2))-methyltransferase RlmN [Verrucomicrobiaceae bacterium]|nr:23S rRNA (adenine(2503)-C(2))-methyltransferase RlmN [Verrucomicrobiaceae bacterium]